MMSSVELSPMSCVGNSSVTVPVMQVLNDDGMQLAADAAQGKCFQGLRTFNNHCTELMIFKK